MHGVTEVTYDRSRDRVLDITVAMNADITPDELLWTSFHELQHVADLTDAALARLSRDQHEMRAIRFAARMMARAAR